MLPCANILTWSMMSSDILDPIKLKTKVFNVYVYLVWHEINVKFISTYLKLDYSMILTIHTWNISTKFLHKRSSIDIHRMAMVDNSTLRIISPIYSKDKIDIGDMSWIVNHWVHRPCIYLIMKYILHSNQVWMKK